VSVELIAKQYFYTYSAFPVSQKTKQKPELFQ